MNITEIASKIDHTLLKPEATYQQIETLCSQALEYNFASVCIFPNYVAYAKSILEKSNVKVCTVIGFPFGINSLKAKLLEAEITINEGAQELDFVVNNGYLKNQEFEKYTHELIKLNNFAKKAGITTKFIIETGLLTESEKIFATNTIAEIGADFVKTSTGFVAGGATEKDVALLFSTAKGRIKVKASGGIRSLQDAEKMILAGAERLGTSSGVSIIKGVEANSNY
jgi:deoxyribose-phosphate aldolase